MAPAAALAASVLQLVLDHNCEARVALAMEDVAAPLRDFLIWLLASIFH